MFSLYENILCVEEGAAGRERREGVAGRGGVRGRKGGGRGKGGGWWGEGGGKVGGRG